MSRMLALQQGCIPSQSKGLMKFWEEINERYGTKYTQADIAIEDANSFITHTGVGWNRNVEKFWKNHKKEDDLKLTNPKPESLAKFVSGLGLDEDEFDT